MSSRDRNTQVYIKGFHRDTDKYDIKDAFRKYGKIDEIQLKNGYAFVRYYDYRDAQDAVKGMDRKYLTKYDNTRLLVEPADGHRRERRRDERPRAGGLRGPQNDDECWYCQKKGHWKNECEKYFEYVGSSRGRFRGVEKRHSSSRSYSSSSSSRSRSSSSSRSGSRGSKSDQRPII